MKKFIAIFLASFLFSGLFSLSPVSATESETTESTSSTQTVEESEPEAEPPAPEVVQEPVEAEPEVSEETSPPVVAPKSENKTKTTTNPDKPWICHPVGGKGETGNGWNLINPNKASSHIDDQGNPKHEHDGRVDTPAINGTCPGEPVEEDFKPYVADACWTMLNSDGIEGTYEFPQDRGCEVPAPTCEEQVVEFQYDKYKIKTQELEDYFNGLTKLNSPADDAILSPHDYYSKVVTVPAKDAADCAPKPELLKEKRVVELPVNCEDHTVTVNKEKRKEILGLFDYETKQWDKYWGEWEVVKSWTRDATDEEIINGCNYPNPEFPTFGTPTCETELYPYTLPEDNEYYTYYFDQKGDGEEPRTFVVTAVFTQTGKTVYSIEHTFPVYPTNCDSVEEPPTTDTPESTDTVDTDRVLPATGSGVSVGGVILVIVLIGAGIYFVRKGRN